MDWMQPRDHLLHGSAPSSAPSFILVDANNRVRELTDPLKRQLGATQGFYHASASDTGLSAAELEEQRQLEQQVQVQKQEMCFVSPLPRPDVGRLRVPATSHALTYGGSRSSTAHATPPLAPPVSPFASMALSAPAAPARKSSHNPFLSAIYADQSPRLPSLNAMRSSPMPHRQQLGIASRPPPLSLRSFSDVSTLSSSSYSPSPSPSPQQQQQQPKAPSRSLSNSSLASSTASTSPMLYSQSLPGVSFLQDRRRSRMSFDASDCASSLLSSDTKDCSSTRPLSSSVGRSEGSSDAMTAAASAAAFAALSTSSARSGRVCRYANCSNIARSRGLCRTHGGGKRCSHPTCNKSAQANRKCIAHGGGTPCSFEDCDKTAQSRGLCKAHGGGARCKHPECPKSSQSKGLCRGHGGGIKCKAEGCDKWVQKNGYCIKHGRERAVLA